MKRKFHLLAAVFFTALSTFAQGNGIGGYNGLICASDFGLWVPPFSVQTVPLFTVRFVPL